MTAYIVVEFTDVSEKSITSIYLSRKLVTCLFYCSILKMEGVYSSETSANFYRLTPPYTR
jgi:hypothetical protein